MFWKLNITPLLCNRLDSFRRPCGWVSSKAAPDTILPIVQWRCRLQSPRSLAFMSCMFAALYTSIGCHQTQHATAFYIWTSPLCSSCACICMSISLCRYRVLILCLYFLSSYKYIYIYTHLYLFKDLPIHLYFIYAYNCILFSLSFSHVSSARAPPQFFSPLFQFHFTLPQFRFTAPKKAPETRAWFPLPCMFPSSAHLFPHSCDL